MKKLFLLVLSIIITSCSFPFASEQKEITCDVMPDSYTFDNSKRNLQEKDLIENITYEWLSFHKDKSSCKQYWIDDFKIGEVSVYSQINTQKTIQANFQIDLNNKTKDNWWYKNIKDLNFVTAYIVLNIRDGVYFDVTRIKFQ